MKHLFCSSWRRECCLPASPSSAGTLGSWCKSAHPCAIIKEANVSACQLWSWRVISVDSAKPLWKADLEKSKTNNEKISRSWLCYNCQTNPAGILPGQSITYFLSSWQLCFLKAVVETTLVLRKSLFVVRLCFTWVPDFQALGASGNTNSYCITPKKSLLWFFPSMPKAEFVDPFWVRSPTEIKSSVCLKKRNWI